MLKPRKWLRAVLPVFCLTLALSACTPTELIGFLDLVGYDHSTWTDQDVADNAKAITDWFQAYYESQDPHTFDKFYDKVSDDQLARLRQCEATGNYNAVGGRGAFRGAYQFSQSTWNAIANAYYPNYAGMDPAGAPPAVQDAMARALFAQQGRRPWPVCGYRM